MTASPHLKARKKLEPELEKAILSQIDRRLHNVKIQEPSVDTQSVMQSATPPWAESYEISSSGEGRIHFIQSWS